MVNKAKIKKVQELIENLSINSFSGILEVRFDSGGVSSVTQTEKLRLEEQKI